MEKMERKKNCRIRGPITIMERLDLENRFLKLFNKTSQFDQFVYVVLSIRHRFLFSQVSQAYLGSVLMPYEFKKYQMLVQQQVTEIVSKFDYI